MRMMIAALGILMVSQTASGGDEAKRPPIRINKIGGKSQETHRHDYKDCSHGVRLIPCSHKVKVRKNGKWVYVREHQYDQVVEHGGHCACGSTLGGQTVVGGPKA